jgi:sugar lactone lactonase YvrE
VVTTLGGAASPFGNAGGNSRSFRSPTGIAVDAGANIYVANCYGPAIQKIAPAGTVTNILGPGPVIDIATGITSEAGHCGAIAIDSRGNVYVAEEKSGRIRKVTPAGVVSTLGGPLGVRFSDPSGIAVDDRGNVFVADTASHTIRKITPSGIVSTLAGNAGIGGSADGTGGAARFSFPRGIAVDAQGNVYVADTMNRTIRKITPAGVVTTLAGSPGLDGNADGTGAAARFNRPRGIAVDRNGTIYVADTNNHIIRKITAAGLVTTLAGSPGLHGDADGTGSAARFRSPNAVAIDGRGNVYVADTDNNMIRRITPEASTSTLLTR